MSLELKHIGDDDGDGDDGDDGDDDDDDTVLILLIK